MTTKGLFFWSFLVLLLSALSFTSHRWHAWLLLFSGDRAEALEAWQQHTPINTAVTYPMRPIAEVQAAGEWVGRWDEMFVISRSCRPNCSLIIASFRC